MILVKTLILFVSVGVIESTLYALIWKRVFTNTNQKHEVKIILESFFDCIETGVNKKRIIKQMAWLFAFYSLSLISIGMYLQRLNTLSILNMFLFGFLISLYNAMLTTRSEDAITTLYKNKQIDTFLVVQDKKFVTAFLKLFLCILICTALYVIFGVIIINTI